MTRPSNSSREGANCYHGSPSVGGAALCACTVPPKLGRGLGPGLFHSFTHNHHSLWPS